MGLELALLPLDCYSPPGDGFTSSAWGFSHQILQLGKHYDLFDDMGKKLTPTPLPEGADVSAFVGASIPDGPHKGETMYGTLDKDPYGDRYTYVACADLLPLLHKHMREHPTTAFIAALVQMRPSALVILSWH